MDQAIALIASVITTAATVILAMLTGRYVRLSARLLEESAAARRDANRPNLSVTVTLLEEDVSFMNLVIENSGLSAAYNLRFKVTQPYKSANTTDLATLGLFKRGVDYFAPRQRYECFLAGGGDEDYQKLRDNPIEIVATYSDAQHGKYSESYVIDFAVFENMSRMGEPPVVKLATATQKIADALGSLGSSHRRVEVVAYTREEELRERRVPFVSIKLRKLSPAAFRRIETLIDKEITQAKPDHAV